MSDEITYAPEDYDSTWSKAVRAMTTEQGFRTSHSRDGRALLEALDVLGVKVSRRYPMQPWDHEGHKPVQHRDRQPPWCNTCGWSSPRPAIPAFKGKDIS